MPRVPATLTPPPARGPSGAGELPSSLSSLPLEKLYVWDNLLRHVDNVRWERLAASLKEASFAENPVERAAPEALQASPRFATFRYPTPAGDAGAEAEAEARGGPL